MAIRSLSQIIDRQMFLRGWLKDTKPDRSPEALEELAQLNAMWDRLGKHNRKQARRLPLMIRLHRNEKEEKAMKVKFIEASGRIAGPDSQFGNYGKFMLARFTEEWSWPSQLPDNGVKMPLLRQVGWGPDHLQVFDLQTGEGCIVHPAPRGSAHADLQKHAVWVCPLFEPFLEWLYQQDLSDLDALPGHVELPDAEFAMSGYRRPGASP